jgi:hypothetical protein
MSKIGDAFQDWLDGGKDSAENRADQAKAEDAKKTEDDKK